ncbi:VOC family protein [Streptomyces sp. NPDC056347]|uniref:VOC family protein n=1 Tax=Streptomyces sp. NPDC056347 TaxID=3345790 RepID=UPI0035D610AC
MTASPSGKAPAPAPLTGSAAPCWVNLTTLDLDSAQAFYGRVLGWTFRRGGLGPGFAIALRGGVPVAGIGAMAAAYRVAVAWTPYFAVADADATAARIRERSGTVAVGPMALGRGRGALVADRDGAMFGIWQRPGPTTSPPAPDDHSHARLRLHTRNAFDAAIFYGEVLGWESGRPGCCEVSYEKDEVVVDCDGHRLARISSGAVEAAPDPLVRPHWQVHFPVGNVAATVASAQANGGRLAERPATARDGEATLLDPDGGLFTVIDAQGSGASDSD